MNYTPDIFAVLIKVDKATNYNIRSYETPFGLTTEKYLFHKNQVLGECFNIYISYKKYGFEQSVYFGVNFLGQPEANMPIDLSNIIDFLTGNTDLVLIFELDCDQYEIDFTSENLNEIINDITNFLESGYLKNKAFIKII